MRKEKNKRAYCIFITAVCILICGLRSKHLGPLNSWGVTDAENVHIPAFLAVADAGWDSVFRGWLSGNSHFRDIGSCIFYKLIALVSTSEQFFLFVVCIPPFVALSRYIYKYSSNPVMSYILLLGLNYFTGAMYLTRHMLALTVVVFAYDFLYRRDAKKYIITILIATLFHKTAIIALVLYPLATIKWGIKHWFAILSSLIVGLFGSKIWTAVLRVIVVFYPTWLNFLNRDFTNEFGQTWFIAVGILLFVLFKKKELYRNNEQLTSSNLNMLALACIFYGLMNLLLEFSRIAMFFMPSALVLLPACVGTFKGYYNKCNRIILALGINLAFGFYYLFSLTRAAGAMPYIFFWK